MAFVKGARNILNTAKNMRAARQSTQASNFANQTRQAGRMSDDVASARSAAQEAARQARNNEATAGAWRSMTYGNNVANPYSGSSIPVNPGRFNPYQGMQQGSINPGW